MRRHQRYQLDIPEPGENLEPFPWEKIGGEEDMAEEVANIDDALRANSDYFKLADGESVMVKVNALELKKIRGFKSSDPNKWGISAQLGTKQGDKLWETAAKNVLEQFRDVQIKAGDTIEVTRVGSGVNTTYSINKVPKQNKGN